MLKYIPEENSNFSFSFSINFAIVIPLHVGGRGLCYIGPDVYFNNVQLACEVFLESKRNEFMLLRNHCMKNTKLLHLHRKFPCTKKIVSNGNTIFYCLCCFWLLRFYCAIYVIIMMKLLLTNAMKIQYAGMHQLYLTCKHWRKKGIDVEFVCLLWKKMNKTFQKTENCCHQQ